LSNEIEFPILSRTVHAGVGAEFGHISIDPRGRFCGCGRRGCVETYVSASGLRRTVYGILAERLDVYRARVRILISGLNNGEAAVLGASCLVRDVLLGVEGVRAVGWKIPDASEEQDRELFFKGTTS